MTAPWIHATDAAPFETFDPALARARTEAERGVVWLTWNGPDADVESRFFGRHLALCQVDGDDIEVVDYTDFDADGDSIYTPDVMAAVLASTDAPVVRIRRVTLVEHGRPRTILAVRDASRITITEWIVDGDEED